jgi:predicted DNA-binding protein (MmcQ/YjbR family)
MTVDFVRELCLGFPHATENMQWGEDLCFKVGGKIFAALNLGAFPQQLSFKCTPDKFAELVEREGIVPAAYVGRYKWVLLQRLDILHPSELEELLKQSYAMVAGKAKILNRKDCTGHKVRRKKRS